MPICPIHNPFSLSNAVYFSISRRLINWVDSSQINISWMHHTAKSVRLFFLPFLLFVSSHSHTSETCSLGEFLFSNTNNFIFVRFFEWRNSLIALFEILNIPILTVFFFTIFHANSRPLIQCFLSLFLHLYTFTTLSYFHTVTPFIILVCFFLFETLCLHSLDKSYHSTVEVKRHEIEWKWFLVVHHHTFGSYTERWIKSSWMLYGLDFVEMSYEASVLIYPIHNFVTFNMISMEYSSW